MLKFNGAWRFNPPPDGRYLNQKIPSAAIREFRELIRKVTTQGDIWDILEHFKGAFCAAMGSTHVRSSTASWAETDLDAYMDGAAENAPVFLEAFFDACESLASSDNFYAPDAKMINSVCRRHNLGYELRPPDLVLLEEETAIAPIEVMERPATLAEEAVNLLQRSLQRSNELLSEGRAREAVQELLWLLESVATAFRGIEMPTNEVVVGKYFNQIIKDLRNGYQGSTLERALEWITALHGYLSSPTGGGIRHGMDLDQGLPISQGEARLFCNLIRSYLSYLLSEHERLTAIQR